jgi:hypothetical protein
MKGRILGFLLLLVWGVAKLPIETRLSEAQKATRFGGFKISSTLRQQAGQAGFLATLGGLRAAVADLLWIRAHVAWQSTQWGKMKLLFDVCTALQPRRVMFWDNAGWHMAWNASVYAMNDTAHVPEQVERWRNQQQYFKLGEDYLLRGIENNPDSWELYDRLAWFYKDKMQDKLKAAAAYEEASKRPGRLDYVRRQAAIMLAECPGHEEEAYKKLKALYDEGEREWLPTLLKQIQRLERKLRISQSERVYIPPEDRLLPE